jgi:hypothetical protein
MKTSAAKQALQKCSFEKCSTAPRTFPVRHTGGDKEVKHEGQREDKGGNDREKADLQYGSNEKRKDQPAQTTIGFPRPQIVSVNIQSAGCFQFRVLDRLFNRREAAF